MSQQWLFISLRIKGISKSSALMELPGTFTNKKKWVSEWVVPFPLEAFFVMEKLVSGD
jgi:hypothetical protein